jgi:hypothetical protein
VNNMRTLLRRLVLLGTPLVLGILEIWYPTPSGTESTFEVIANNADWWFTLHVLQLPLFGLMALAVYLLVDGLHGWAAAISRPSTGTNGRATLPTWYRMMLTWGYFVGEAALGTLWHLSWASARTGPMSLFTYLESCRR